MTEYLDGRIEIKYISAHSNHDLGSTELPYLPLPKGVKEEIAVKISLGIPPERIMEGEYTILQCGVERRCGGMLVMIQI